MLLLTTILCVNGCSLAPDFTVPDQALPAQFKEAPQEAKGDWKPAVSLEQEARGEWWKIFADARLDILEAQAMASNASLQAASARVEQSRALVGANASSFLPTIGIGANAVRAKMADASTAGFSSGPASSLKPYTLYSAEVTASYELDVFSRVRNNESALTADADAQRALYRSVLLALQADVAQHYFSLQAMDAKCALVKQTVAIRREEQRIMQKRLAVGSVSAVEANQTTSEYADAQSSLILLDRDRAVLENALAVLLGQNPSEFHFEESPMASSVTPPLVPAGIPSEMLQRRPDIAAAQAAMQAANLRIGVARTAFFPSLILTATGGLQSTDLADIFKWSSRSWALGQTAGSALVMTLFDSGRNAARVDIAQASYAEEVANYRQHVLVAMGDVENALSNQRLLANQSREQEKSASATRHVLALTKKRYDQGDVNYKDVVDADRGMLAANRAAIDTRANRLIATVTLLRALGGGWNDTATAPVMR